MQKILGDLAEDDYFGLITFDSYVHAWNPELLQATETNLQKAKSFVGAIQAQGGKKVFNLTRVLMKYNLVKNSWFLRDLKVVFYSRGRYLNARGNYIINLLINFISVICY